MLPAYVAAMGTDAVSFGHITFDTEEGLLLRDGAALSISHRAIALLRSLVEHEGQPVSKAALSEAAWPSTLLVKTYPCVSTYAFKLARPFS